ncbi:MAG TPA: hypothetical protein VIX37_04720, partial [Candidatus Sulfotelmatobacter sp.]
MGFGSIGGGGGSGGGIPEPPFDGVLYGRRNTVWHETTAPLNVLVPPIPPWATVQEAIAGITTEYLPLTGGTLTGVLILDRDPTLPLEAVTLQYLDDAIAGIPLMDYVAKTGDTMTGGLVIDRGTAGVSLLISENIAGASSGIVVQNLNPSGDASLLLTNDGTRGLSIAVIGWANGALADNSIITSNLPLIFNMRDPNDTDTEAMRISVDGDVSVSHDPNAALDVATKQYVDTQAGDIYFWRQPVNANSQRLNSVLGIGVRMPSDQFVGVIALAQEGFRSQIVDGDAYTMVRVMVSTSLYGALLAWGPFAPSNYANTVSIATSIAPITLSPNNIEVMRIAPSNRVGILNSNPGYPLDVTGQIRSTTGYVFGDLTVQTTAAIGDAPFDPFTYGRSQNVWVRVLAIGGGDMTGPLILAANPTLNMGAATKQYVDNLASGAIHFIGNINASIGSVQYAQGSGFIDGPVIPAANAPGGFIICVIAGTVPPGGPIGGMVLIVGDWVLSNGIVWTRVAIGVGAISASQVTLVPAAFGAGNVQDSLNNAETEVDNRVRLTGDTMTGLLTLSGNPTTALQAVPRQWVDVRGVPAGGFTGQALTKSSATDYATTWTSVPLEAPDDNLTYGRRSLNWSRAVSLGGDTMTGALIVQAKVTAQNYEATIDNTGYQTARTGLYYAATGQGLMLRQTTGNEQPQIENNNGSNRRIILDALNGVTLGTTQTIAGAKTFSASIAANAGVDFGTATVTAPSDLTRHIRLWAGTGVTGYGFSVSSNRLNYVVVTDSGVHSFISGTTVAGAEWAIISSAGITTPVDGNGLITYGGGRFYKAVGTGVVIRAAAGNVQPQIEDNNGTNRRNIIDSLTGVTLATEQTITATKTFTTAQVLQGNHNWVINRTSVAWTPGVMWQENGVFRWQFRPTADAAMNLVLSPYNDAGVAQTNALTVNRTTGLITVRADPTADLGIATRQYVDAVTGGNFVTIGTAQTITGAKTFTTAVTTQGSVNFVVNRTAVTQRAGFTWNESGVFRWQWRPTGDAAMNLGLTRANDAGTAQTDAIVFDRATGLATVIANPTANLGVVTKQYSDLNNFHYTSEADLPAMDLNLLVPATYRSGEYSLGSGKAFTNLPPGLSTNGTASNRFLLMMSHAPTPQDVFQVLYDIAQSPSRIWTRYKVDGAATWSAWLLTASSATTDAANFVLKAGDSMTGGLGFGTATVTSPLDLTRHVRLWQGTGNTGYGFSVSADHLNYVANNNAGIHAFINPSNAAVGSEWATISTAGVTTPLDGTGFITNGGGRFYKASGTGVVIRQVGISQPQIENNDGTNRRVILDALNGVVKAGDTGLGNMISANGAYYKFAHVNPTDVNDGRVGCRLFARGLNIIGSATEPGNAQRYVHVWGVLEDEANVPYAKGNGAPNWSTGSDYPVGRLVMWEGLLFRVVTAITGAPATPNFATIVPYDAPQGDYFQGAPSLTNWADGNWMQLATFPPYGNFRFQLDCFGINVDSSVSLEVTTSFSSASVTVTSYSRNPGNAMWQQF